MSKFYNVLAIWLVVYVHLLIIGVVAALASNNDMVTQAVLLFYIIGGVITIAAGLVVIWREYIIPYIRNLFGNK